MIQGQRKTEKLAKDNAMTDTEKSTKKSPPPTPPAPPKQPVFRMVTENKIRPDNTSEVRITKNDKK
ncbi:TPA: hypothetical protein VCC33_003309 [Kluyvera cryocrescens]|nr:hypothetical protein [Kluyvera cryocrescens]